jgi:integrase
MATGIRKLHSKGCPAKEGKRCRCNAGYEASAFSKREGRKLRKTFDREGEAKTWRADMISALDKGIDLAPTLVPTAKTIGEAWGEWLSLAKRGAIQNRSRKPFKPSTLRSYEQVMRLRVLPVWASVPMVAVRRGKLQEFADGLAEDLSPSAIQVTFLPLRALYRRSLALEEPGIDFDPCSGLSLPAVNSRRERIAPPTEARALIEAIPKADDRAIWATAMYAGLRRGELRALRREDVDLAAGVILVRKGWDAVEGEIELKSEAGRRRVPIAAVLRDYLLERISSRDFEPADRIFGNRKCQAFSADKLQMRADEAWEAAGLKRITLHECRHTFASTMIDAMVRSPHGLNPKALQTFMGHSKISVTFDVYGKLMPGAEAQGAEILDAYLTAQHDAAEQAVRGVGGELSGEPTGEPTLA